MIRRKVIMLGDLGVGKTSLSRRIVYDLFDHNYRSTIGVDVFEYDQDTTAGPMRFMLWDAEGNFIDDSLKAAYLRGASGALIVGDITRPRTIAKMVAALRTFRLASPGRPASFALNKSDLLPEAEMAEIVAHAEAEIAEPVIATSALRGDNVARAFEHLAEQMARLPDD